jgi:hypothetical protein
MHSGTGSETHLKRLIPDLLNIIGLDKVLWIGDDFSVSAPERQKLRVRESPEAID